MLAITTIISIIIFYTFVFIYSKGEVVGNFKINGVVMVQLAISIAVAVTRSYTRENAELQKHTHT